MAWLVIPAGQPPACADTWGIAPQMQNPEHAVFLKLTKVVRCQTCLSHPHTLFGHPLMVAVRNRMENGVLGERDTDLCPLHEDLYKSLPQGVPECLSSTLHSEQYE